MMREELKTIERPELIVGIAGPIGVQSGWVIAALQNSLRSVGYDSVTIKVSSEMMAFKADIPPACSKDYASQALFKMAYATELCRSRKDPALLSAISVRAIQRERKVFARNNDTTPEHIAYIVSQFKRPQEVELLRRVYGRQFILVSAYGSVEARAEWIVEQIRRHRSAELDQSEAYKLASDLIEKDADENLEMYGQHLRDTFHKGDVFVNGMDKADCHSTVERFIQALFGRTDIAPSKNEYGMYAAKSASLRSSDLSRQVGAAIFTEDGELITQGCNEVPKAFGGTYWDLEKPDFRDVKIGHDPNEQLKNEILRDLFSRLRKSNFLSEEVMAIGDVPDIVLAATKKQSLDQGERGPLVGALIMDLTEYGRVVHAEMCAICDAARLGRSIKGGILFCTTFPCHNCTKHILAAGIVRVVYMEPYPKSRAKELHKNEIEIDEQSGSRVSFVPFMGISPDRYREIFQKTKRKTSGGDAFQWFGGTADDRPTPMLEVVFPAYTRSEDRILLDLISDSRKVSPTSEHPSTEKNVDPED